MASQSLAAGGVNLGIDSTVMTFRPEGHIQERLYTNRNDGRRGGSECISGRARSGAHRERSRRGAQWPPPGAVGCGDGEPLRVPGGVPCAKRGARTHTTPAVSRNSWLENPDLARRWLRERWRLLGNLHIAEIDQVGIIERR